MNAPQCNWDGCQSVATHWGRCCGEHAVDLESRIRSAKHGERYMSNSELGPLQTLILESLEDGPKHTAEISDDVGRDRSTIYGSLQRLRNRGLVESRHSVSDPNSKIHKLVDVYE